MSLPRITCDAFISFLPFWVPIVCYFSSSMFASSPLFDLSLSLSVMVTFTNVRFLISLCLVPLCWVSYRAHLIAFVLLVILSVFMLLLFVLMRRCRLLALAFFRAQDGLEVKATGLHVKRHMDPSLFWSSFILTFLSSLTSSNHVCAPHVGPHPSDLFLFRSGD